jgi:hypothetical protein
MVLLNTAWGRIRVTRVALILCVCAGLANLAAGNDYPVAAKGPGVQAGSLNAVPDFASPEMLSFGGLSPDARCGPQWYARTEVLFLQRDNDPLDQPLVVSDATGDVLLRTSDLGFNMVLGPSLLVGRRIDSATAFELSYFGTQFWSSSARVTAVNDLDLPGVIVGAANDFDNADRMIFRNTAQLHNAEFNYVYRYNSISVLYGFRYLNWEETYNINSTDSDGDTSDYNLRASNNLFGAQVGTRIDRRWCHLDWQFSGKVGIFGNAAMQRQLLLDNGNTFVLRDTRQREANAAFVGDLNLSVFYALNSTWRIRAGYNILWLEGLALGPNQLDFTDDLSSGTRLRSEGGVFLHGANIGLEAGW